MADYGDRILCHACGGISLKEDGRDLICPHCESDCVEIIEIPPDTEVPEQSSAANSLRNNPFADDDGDMFASSFRYERRPQEFRDNPIGFMEPMFQESPRFSRHSYRSPDGRFTFTTTSIRGGTSASSFQHGNGYPNPTVPLMQGIDTLFQALSQPRGEDRYSQMPRPGWDEDLHRGVDDYPDPEEQAPQDRSARGASPPGLAEFLASFNPDYERTQRRQGAFGGAQGVAGPNPLAMLSALLNMNRNGDAVYSQLELDRVISQLIDQNAPGSAPPPASTTAIRSLPKKKIDQEMLGSDGNAECSICMDRVELGTEVTVLPCTHWFHFPCIEAWLTQHNTCPHCRRAIDMNNTCGSVPLPRPIRVNPPIPEPLSTSPLTMRRYTLNQNQLADFLRPTSTTGNGTSDDPVIIQDSPEAASSTRRRGRSSPFSSLRGRSSFSRSNTNSSGPSSPTPGQNDSGTRRSSRSSRNSRNSREGRGVSGWFWSRFGGTSST